MSQRSRFNQTGGEMTWVNDNTTTCNECHYRFLSSYPKFQLSTSNPFYSVLMRMSQSSNQLLQHSTLVFSTSKTDLLSWYAMAFHTSQEHKKEFQSGLFCSYRPWSITTSSNVLLTFLSMQQFAAEPYNGSYFVQNVSSNWSQWVWWGHPKLNTCYQYRQIYVPCPTSYNTWLDVKTKLQWDTFHY